MIFIPESFLTIVWAIHAHAYVSLNTKYDSGLAYGSFCLGLRNLHPGPYEQSRGILQCRKDRLVH